MIRWTEAFLLALLVGAGLPRARSLDAWWSGGPGLTSANGTAPQSESGGASRDVTASRAVVLAEAELYEDPSSTGDVVTRVAAGTVLEYIGETTDAFGRTWYAVRDPERSERRVDTYLAPFTFAQFRSQGYRGAVMADRRPSRVAGAGRAAAAVAAAAAAGGGEQAQAWWRPVAVLDATAPPTYGEVVGVSARAPREADVREAIELFGGLDALGRWPQDPAPGELFIPELVPALFRFDGDRWDLARPVRLLDRAVSLIGNGNLTPNSTAPPVAGGPVIDCWQLVNALDPAGSTVGTIAPAPPLTSPNRGAPAPRDMGPFDMTQAPERLRGLLPPAPDTTLVPPRIDPAPPQTGALLSDEDGRQAVFLRQRLGEGMTARLRGRSLVLDVVARDDPRASAATFGVFVEVTLADGTPAQEFLDAFTSRPAPRRYELPFVVAENAVDVIIRLLPLDRGLAVEQQGSVVFDRVALRLSSWEADPPAAAVVLHRVASASFQGARLYTRAPVAPTERSGQDLEQAWRIVSVNDWPVEDRKTVLAGDLRHGMTPEQVRAAWGEPAEEGTRSGDDALVWRWAGDDRYVLFSGGEVIGFRPPIDQSAAEAPMRCPGPAPLR